MSKNKEAAMIVDVELEQPNRVTELIYQQLKQRREKFEAAPFDIKNENFAKALPQWYQHDNVYWWSLGYTEAAFVEQANIDFAALSRTDYNLIKDGTPGADIGHPSPIVDRLITGAKIEQDRDEAEHQEQRRQYKLAHQLAYQANAAKAAKTAKAAKAAKAAKTKQQEK